MSAAPQIVPVYNWTEAKKAYERGERAFYVYPRYPLSIQRSDHRSCDKCKDGANLCHFERRLETNAVILHCKGCGARLEGGLYEVGITTKDRRKDKDRLFNSVQREAIFKRDHCRCYKCGAGPMQDVLECDHIIPASKGGPTEILNGITLCGTCNGDKSDSFDRRFITNALIYTHDHHLDQIGKGSGHLRGILSAAAASLKEWGCWELGSG